MKKACLAVAAFVLLAANPSLQAQVSVSNEDIPYGISDLNCTLTLMRSSRVVYASYENGGKDMWGNATYTQTLQKINKTVFGPGMDLHVSLLYLWLSRDKSRLRIADAEVIGFNFGGNHQKCTEYETGNKLPSGGGLGVGGSYVFAAGLKAYYRISNAIDIGVAYYPYYAYIDAGATVTGNTTGAFFRGYGAHLRVGRIYADFLDIKMPSKQTENWDHGPTYNGYLRFLYGEKFRFLSFNAMYQSVKSDVVNVSGYYMTPDVSAKGPVPQKWWVYQVGWGMMF